jgi:hypothetical protein
MLLQHTDLPCNQVTQDDNISFLKSYFNTQMFHTTTKIQNVMCRTQGAHLSEGCRWRLEVTVASIRHE